MSADPRHLREKALRESDLKYRELVENTFDLLCSMDANGVLQYVGPQARQYGFEPEDVEGRYFADFILAADRDRIAAEFRKKLADGEAFPSEFRVRAPDGAIYWFEERSTLQRDAAGVIHSLTVILRDITERKQAEARERVALHRLQAFETAVNQGPAVVFRWRIVPGEWPVETVSANVQQFGYEAEDLLSGRVSWTGITHPDDVPRLEKQVGAYLENGVRQFHMRYRLIAKSGAIHQIEDWNIVTADQDGRPTHINAIVLDVTKHYEEEKKRRESDERYRRLFEAEPDAILLFDAETRRIVDVNPAALTLYGRTRDEFLGLTHRDVTAEPEASEETMTRALEDKQGLIPLRWHRKKDGTVFPVEIAPGRFALNGRTVLCGIVRDITERRRREQLLLDYQKRLRNLAAGLATAQDEEQRRIAEGLHDDVAQMLVACSLKMEVARKVSDPAELRALHEGTEEMLREVHEKIRLLSFELSSSTLYRLGLREAIQEVCDTMAGRYGGRFEVKGEAGVGVVDEAMSVVLFKAVRELLFNVVKHSGAKEATVSIRRCENMLELAVEDHGVGFPDGHEANNLAGGQSMGLFGIRERLRDLGGEMQIESTPNVHTRVTLRAPMGGSSACDAAPERKPVVS